MKVIIKSERSDSGVFETKYKLAIPLDYYPVVDVETHVFSLTTSKAKEILQQHIDIAHTQIELIDEMERAYCNCDNLSNEEQPAPPALPVVDTRTPMEKKDKYIVTANIPIKGTIGTIKKTVENVVELFIPFNNKSIIFYLRTDQVSKVVDATYCRVVVNGDEINTATSVRMALEQMGMKTIFPFYLF